MKFTIITVGQEIIARMWVHITKETIPVLVDALSTYLFKLEAYIKTQKLSGQVLKVRTGALRGLIRAIPPIVREDRIIGGISVGGVATKYARIHEFGGTIVPKTKQFLTVPFPGVLGRAMDYQNTFIAKGIIFQKIDKGIKPLFALKKSVTIPARPYLVPSLEETLPELALAIDKALDKIIGES